MRVNSQLTYIHLPSHTSMSFLELSVIHIVA